MNTCKNCKVSLPGNYKRCPLCKGELTGTGSEEGNVFPVVHPEKADPKLLCFLAFCTVAGAAVCVAVNLIFPADGWWSLFVIGGVCSFWISFLLILKKRKNIPKTLLWQVGILSLLAWVWDHFTGNRGWALNYVFPILCTGAMVAMFVVAKARRLNIQSYIMYLILDCVIGILPFILLVTGKVHVIIPSAVCFASTIIFLAELFLFEGKAFCAEIQRRFHL